MEAVHAAAPSESAIGRLGDAPLMSYEIDARTRRRSSVPLIARSDLDNDLDGGLEAEAAKRAAASLARATCLETHRTARHHVFRRPAAGGGRGRTAAHACRHLVASRQRHRHQSCHPPTPFILAPFILAPFILAVS